MSQQPEALQLAEALERNRILPCGDNGNTANDADALRVVTTAIVTTPAKAGPRKVCVRVEDVFGFEAEVVTTVGAA